MLKKNLKDLLNHSLIYSFAWISSSMLSILLLPIYTRYLTKADYGILEILDYTNAVLRLIMVAGFHSSLAKFYNGENDPENKSTVISTGLIFVFTSALIGCSLCIFNHDSLSALLFGEGDYSKYVIINMVVLFADLLSLISTTYFVVSKKSKLFLMYNMIRMAIGVCANLYFLIVLKLGVMGMLLGSLSATGFIAIVLTTHVLMKNRFHFDFKLLKRMLKFSLPIIPAMLCATVMHNSDRFLIRYYCSLPDVGLYGLGYKFPFMLNALILQSFSYVWSGATMYEISKQPDAKYQYAKITTYFITFFVFMLFALSVFSSPVVRILAAPKFFAAHQIIPLVALGLCFHAFYIFFTVGAFLKEKTWLLSMSYAPAAAINIIGNILLLPLYGYMAAAWMSVITYFSFAVFAYFSCRRALKITFEYKRLTAIFLFAILSYLFSSLYDFENLILEIFKGFFFVVFFIGLTMISGWATASERQAIREKFKVVLNKLHYNH